MALGLALRIAISTTDGAPATDETAYLRSGMSLVEGDGFAREGHPELHFPPFVPLLLGLAGEVFADPHVGTVVLTTVASTALILPLALLGRRVGGPAAGVAVAWIAALTPGISTSLVNRGAGSEAEYMLVVVLALWWVVSAADHRGGARLWRIAGSGGLVGLAYLTRPEGLFVAVPLGIAVVVLGCRAPGPPGRRLRSAGVLVAAFAIPIVACVAPYAGYLHRHTGEWQLSAKTQDASIEAWQAVASSDRRARDAVLYELDDTGLVFAADRTSLPALARDDPGGYLGIVGTNVTSLGEIVADPESGRVLSWLLLPLPVWALAAWGAWRHRRVRTMQLLLAVGALPVATALVFFVQPRYLMLTTALATVPAGAALRRCRSGRGARRRSPSWRCSCCRPCRASAAPADGGTRATTRTSGPGRVARRERRRRRTSHEPKHGRRVLRRAADDGHPLRRPRPDHRVRPALRRGVPRGRLVHGPAPPPAAHAVAGGRGGARPAPRPRAPARGPHHADLRVRPGPRGA